MNPDTRVETTDATEMPSNFCGDVTWSRMSHTTLVADDHAVVTQLSAETADVAVGSVLTPRSKFRPSMVMMPPEEAAELTGARLDTISAAHDKRQRQCTTLSGCELRGVGRTVKAE